MKRSYISTLMMAVVFGALIAWYLGYEKNLRPKQEEAESKTKQLVTLKQDEVQELMIEKRTPSTTDAKKADGNKKEADAASSTELLTIKIKKTGTEWNITEPVQDLADAVTINSMVSAITGTKYDRIVEEKPKDLSEYELKEPLLTLTIRKNDTSPGEKIMLGRDTPVGAAVYARNGVNETVYKVASTLRSTCNHGLKDLRNKSILNGVARNDVGEIEVQAGTNSVVLKRGDKDDWTLTREGFPADTNETNKLLGAVIDLRATDFAADNDTNAKKFATSKPAVKVFLTKKTVDKTRVVLWLGSVKDKTYAKREDRNVIYVVDKAILDKVNRPAPAFRNVELAHFNRFDVKRIKIERGKDVLEFSKGDSGAWSLPADSKLKLDPAKVDSLLAHAQDIKIAKYADAKTNVKSSKTGLESPKMVLRLFEKSDKQDTEKVTLSFGSKDGSMVYVSRSGLDLPFLIKEEDFKRLDMNKQDFVKSEEKPDAKKAAEKKS